jgi:hypothetical protein
VSFRPAGMSLLSFRLSLLLMMLVAGDVAVNAQTVVDPRNAQFNASPDHSATNPDGSPALDHYELVPRNVECELVRRHERCQCVRHRQRHLLGNGQPVDDRPERHVDHWRAGHHGRRGETSRASDRSSRRASVAWPALQRRAARDRRVSYSS